MISKHLIKLIKISCAFKFFTKLFKFFIKDIYIYFNEKKEDSSIDDKMQTGFSNFLKCLNLYLDLDLFNDLIIYEDSQVKIYRSVILENGTIIHITSSYYDKT